MGSLWDLPTKNYFLQLHRLQGFFLQGGLTLHVYNPNPNEGRAHARALYKSPGRSNIPSGPEAIDPEALQSPPIYIELIHNRTRCVN